MKKTFFLCLLIIQSFIVLPNSILSTFSNSRPRILIDHNTFKRIKLLSQTDTLLCRYIDQVVQYADVILEKELPIYHVDRNGGNLLGTSRDCLERVLTLSVAYHCTDNIKYAEQAKQTLLRICSFEDWNFYHFLDVAEMATAVSVGYDWLYNYLDNTTREKIRLALIRNALVPGLAVYGYSPWQYWLDVDHNWNQVCNGGLTIASLAIADTDPIYAEKIIPQAIENIPHAMKSYAPDGAWGEGVSYWFYATRYTVYCLNTLLSSLGTDFELSCADGFDRAGYFPIYMTTPSGAYFSFADISQNNGSKPLPIMFWLSERFNNPHFKEYEHRMLQSFPATALDVVYYSTPDTDKTKPLPLDKQFGGAGEFVTMRQNPNGQDGLYIAISGGDNRINHGHLDKGGFELEKYGIKWVQDLGSDDYTLPDYWGFEEGGGRWKYFRLGSWGHSVPIINFQNQKVNADTYFEKTLLNTDEPLAIINLSNAYSHVAKSVKRGYKLINGRSELLLLDEYESYNYTNDIQWQIITHAEIQGKGQSLTLVEAGQKMRLDLITPNMTFEIESAEQKEPEAQNKGYKKICIKIKNPRPKEKIAVLFSFDNVPHKRVSVLSENLSDW